MTTSRYLFVDSTILRYAFQEVELGILKATNQLAKQIAHDYFGDGFLEPRRWPAVVAFNAQRISLPLLGQRLSEYQQASQEWVQVCGVSLEELECSTIPETYDRILALHEDFFNTNSECLALLGLGPVREDEFSKKLDWFIQQILYFNTRVKCLLLLPVWGEERLEKVRQVYPLLYRSFYVV